MALYGYIEGSMPVIAQRISVAVFGSVQALTEQTELLLVLTGEVLVLLLFVKMFCEGLFARTSYLSDTIEHVIIRFLDLFVLITGFCVMTLLIAIILEVHEQSPLRWPDAVQVLFLLLSFLFLVIEKFKHSETGNKKRQ